LGVGHCRLNDQGEQKAQTAASYLKSIRHNQYKLQALSRMDVEVALT
jgi:hypothetical protein